MTIEIDKGDFGLRFVPYLLTCNSRRLVLSLFQYLWVWHTSCYMAVAISTLDRHTNEFWGWEEAIYTQTGKSIPLSCSRIPCLFLHVFSQDKAGQKCAIDLSIYRLRQVLHDLLSHKLAWPKNNMLVNMLLTEHQECSCLQLPVYITVQTF